MDNFLTCKQCRFVKQVTEFYAGNRSRCKDCVRAAVRSNRNEKIDYYRDYDRSRGNRPDRVIARKAYQRTSEGRAAHQRAISAWRKREPDRYAAHVALGNAIRDGKVKRHPCWVCGENAEAHHAAYDLPLDVVWLCNQHHREAHVAASLYHSPPAHPAASRASAERIARRVSLVRG